MAHTLLAVDDSVTMRKVLEITFAGPDFRVVTANSPDAALQKLKADKPDIVIADGTLEPRTGYDLCKEIKKLSPSTPVLFLSSKQNPYDPAKGTGSGVDDHIDKPFDTQQMIDKIKKLLSQPAVQVPVAAAAAAQPAAKPAAQPVAAAAQPAARPVTTPSAGAGAPAPAATRAKTLIYNPPTAGGPAIPGLNAPAVQPAPQPAAAKPAAAAIAPTPAVSAPAQARPAPAAMGDVVATAQFNGQMTTKLEQIGLTPTQVEAVLALSRDVIERVVWEVVPVLAETLIKEEIARLTK